MQVVDNTGEIILKMTWTISANTLLDSVTHRDGRENLMYPPTSIRRGLTVGREDVAPLPVDTYLFMPASPG